MSSSKDSTPLTSWWSSMSGSGGYPSVHSSNMSPISSNRGASSLFGSTLSLNGVGVDYTDDLAVASTILREKLNSIYESFVGKDSSLSFCGFGEDGRIAMRVDNVYLVDRLGTYPNLLGTIHVTTTHIIFRADDGSKELWLATGLISSVEKGSLTAAGCLLVIRCKHFQVISLLISRDRSCQELYETLLRASKPVNVTELLAFENRVEGDETDGWNRLDWNREMSRQGVPETKWIESDINSNYQVCDTYPNKLWVPVSSNTHILMGSCRFRSRGRLPVLTYYHKQSEAALCRCAQPLSGFSARCVEDEKLMELIGKINPNSDTLYLVDTRPKLNAMVNKAQGKGFEDARNYSNMRFHFFDIENIHVMRLSQAKLLEAVTKSKEIGEYWKMLESSGWLKHLRIIVECAVFLAETISCGTSCVVHCSDGWDRTSQVIALSQLLMDPFYRTIRGFQVLIEKDWLGFGHKFDDRCAHVGALNDEAAKEISPIFTQFLDCVWQLMQQRPKSFEFNERYLIEMHEHVYSCQFGTFIGNCEKDRRDLNVQKRTHSLWSWMDERIDDYLNPFYEETKVLMQIDTRACFFKVWKTLYNRFDEGILPRERVEDIAESLNHHIELLESYLEQLKMKKSGIEADENCNNIALKWQSLRGIQKCTNITCRGDFASPIDRRIHCHLCGQIFCRRCLCEENGNKMCSNCKSECIKN